MGIVNDYVEDLNVSETEETVPTTETQPVNEIVATFDAAVERLQNNIKKYYKGEINDNGIVASALCLLDWAIHETINGESIGSMDEKNLRFLPASNALLDNIRENTKAN